MAIHEVNILRKFRVECLSKAEKNVQYYTTKNKKVLTELITKAVDDLKSRDSQAIIASSYKLHSAASSFSRPDISNLADLLKRMMKNPAFATSEKVLKSFEEALIELSGIERPSAAQEKKALDSIYKVLRTYSA